MLDAALIAQLQGLRLTPRRAQEASLLGHRVSARLKGASSEFVDYRSYVPGDDTRRIDWKLYGRTDRYHLRSYEGETNCALSLFVDVSRSMTLKSRDTIASKWEAACRAALGLAYMALKHQDACGLALFSQNSLSYLPPKTGWQTLPPLTDKLSSFNSFGEQTNYGASFSSLLERLPRRSLIIVISDFLGDSVEKTAASLEALASARHEVLALRILDPLEIDLTPPQSFNAPVKIKNLERDSPMQVETELESLQTEYVKRFQEEEKRMETLLASKGVSLVRIRTDEDLGTQLVAGLIRQGLAARSR